MTDKLFYNLWLDALEQPNLEMYIGEYGYPDWFDEISKNADEVISTLTAIHHVAHLSIKDMLKEANLTHGAFAVKFCIPLRTVENWSAEVNKCPDYTRLLIARQLGFL